MVISTYPLLALIARKIVIDSMAALLRKENQTEDEREVYVGRMVGKLILSRLRY